MDYFSLRWRWVWIGACVIRGRVACDREADSCCGAGYLGRCPHSTTASFLNPPKARRSDPASRASSGPPHISRLTTHETDSNHTYIISSIFIEHTVSLPLSPGFLIRGLGAEQDMKAKKYCCCCCSILSSVCLSACLLNRHPVVASITLHT